jgi:tetratricopeptide (TPR) repeat protein
LSPGRNDACPCGSGRKYKHCCGALPGAAVAAAGLSQAPQPQQTGTLAAQEPGAVAALISQGRLSEAERQASALLQRSPDSGVLWKILGVALGRQGKEALPALRRAAELLPDDAEAHRNLGAELLARGQPEEALVSLRRALENQPRDVAVLMAAANALGALGRAREAVPLYERALEIDAHLPDVQNNLGNAFQELGEPAKAVDCYRQALAIQPNDAEIHCNLGNALRQLGELPEAIASSQQAIALQPGLSTAHNNLGLALAAQGRCEEAVASFRQAVRLNPHFVDALNNLGNVLRELGRSREALPLYRQAVDLDPQRADIHLNLGNARYESREVAGAEASFRNALQLRPEDTLAHLGLAATLRLDGRTSEAEASCRAALATDPNSVAALSLLAYLLGDRGEFRQAQELSERALAIDASFPPVFCSIAANRKMTSADTAWLQGAEALLAKRQPLEYEIGLRFALGKYHDDLRQYDQAFSQYRQANELSKRSAPEYERAKVTRQIDETISTFGTAFVRQTHAGACASELPVLIVGMPRSGTSLNEQILASHPAVFGAGEVRFWDSAFEAFMTQAPAGDARASLLAGVARDYLARISQSAGAAQRVVDKMPANFLYAGLIHTVFPHAKILHMQRNPIDTCLSIYFQNFVAMSPYASDLEDLAHYYREYVRITNHWRAVLPATTLLEIPYEALIDDQEYWTRRMLDFIGLPWDARCLDFHQTERVVITASRWQVRQKISAGSVGRWRNYEKYLAPLRQLENLVNPQGQRPPEAAASAPGRRAPP